VDPAQAAALSRPAQVSGSFAPPPAHTRPTGPDRAPVPEIVLDAFGRPPGTAESLQRPDPAPEQEVQLETGDPWRDPKTGVTLGAPAESEPGREAPEPPPAERFTLREALFQRRLRPGALVAMLVTALVIGAGGALLGVFLGGRGGAVALGGSYTLATAQPAVSRPAGSVASIAQRVVPAVVSLEVRTGNTGDTGSGVVINSDGFILTNNHVISLAASDSDAALTVVFNDGKGTRVPGTIVGRDPASDLAVVKVDGVDNITVAQLGDSNSLQVGDEVVAVGSPLGLAGTVTTGIVSSLHRPVRLSGEGTDTDAVIDAIQTDAAINPGNSGGPLVDATGAVVGINTAIRTLGDTTTGQATGSIGLGFAIPIDYARSIAQTLINHGKVSHPTIGVNARSATDGTTDGAQVQNVADGGPAAKAGIVEGDVIVKVGDRSVGSADELTVAVQQHKVGQTVPVVLLRQGKQMTVQVTLAAG
jgi:putative serine protease PepD